MCNVSMAASCRHACMCLQQRPAAAPTLPVYWTGQYHNKIHIAMEYTSIFRSAIVYSIGEQKPLSIVAIEYAYIAQIPSNQAVKQNMPFSL